MKVKGFYLVGFFPSKKQAMFSIERTRPFEFDKENGTVNGKLFRGFKRNDWADEWWFFETKNVKDVNTDIYLREDINGVWKSWCKKHHRKYSPIMLKLTEKKDERD